MTAVAEPDIALAERLLDALREGTGGPDGICRDSYGAGEQFAHDLVAAEAARLGLETTRDAALNLYVTLPGRDRAAPRIIIGSHLDSVPNGGNFDGAAGVLGGFAILAGLRRHGVVPARDITLMAIRAEESPWFDVPYVGSRAALGHLSGDELAVTRRGTGRTLAAHIRELGGDPDTLRVGRAHLDPAGVSAFVEIHIEQGPVLEAAGLPVGIVTAIRGCRRFRNAACFGRVAHSGAEPRAYRSDPVAATAELVRELDSEAEAKEARGEDLTFTVGEFYTDPASHGPSQIAGSTRFVLDIRSTDNGVMRAMETRATDAAQRIAAARRVRFELGPVGVSQPAEMDLGWRARLARAAERTGVPHLTMASGGGHDASVFANTGIPSAILFVRNQNGSHNPHEDMRISDLAAACRTLSDAIEHDL